MTHEHPLWRLTRIIGLAVLLSAVAILYLSRQARPGMGGLATGSPMPKIQATGWLNGHAPAMEDLRGQVVVVDAWATWCGPCRAAAPHLVKVYRQFKDQGVVFIGLTDEGPNSLPEIEQFLLENGITWLNGYGATETLIELQVEAIPALWVFGRDGRVVWNFNSPGELEDGIAQALAESR